MILFRAFWLVLFATTTAAVDGLVQAERPRLIVQFTIDQLRGDILQDPAGEGETAGGQHGDR